MVTVYDVGGCRYVMWYHSIVDSSRCYKRFLLSSQQSAFSILRLSNAKYEVSHSVHRCQSLHHPNMPIYCSICTSSCNQSASFHRHRHPCHRIPLHPIRQPIQHEPKTKSTTQGRNPIIGLANKTGINSHTR